MTYKTELINHLQLCRARLKNSRGVIILMENEIEVNMAIINSIKSEAYKHGIDLSDADIQKEEAGVSPYQFQGQENDA